jgi:hypothetical protein
MMIAAYHLSRQNPHVHSGTLRIEDLIFGFIRLSSYKYQKQPGKSACLARAVTGGKNFCRPSFDTNLGLASPDHPSRFERFLGKHLMPFALSDEPDVLTKVGLGKVDEIIPHPQQRAVLKLFTKFSGMDAPEQVTAGESLASSLALC